MAWRVMDSIDPNISNDARMVKQEMSDWLDLQPREKKYDEEYTSGCDSTWEQLFNLEFCEWDLSDSIQADYDEEAFEEYCQTHNCLAPTTRSLDCDKFENMFKEAYAKKHGLDINSDSIPDSCEAGDFDSDYEIEYDCMNGAVLDCNNDGVAGNDINHMSTCYDTHSHRLGGDCGECAYTWTGKDEDGKISSGHKQIDLHCAGGEMSRSGVKVFSMQSGIVVVNSPVTGGWGWEVVVYSCGTLTHFNHLHYDKMMDMDQRAEDGIPNVGDWVNPGDPIGYLGGGVRCSGKGCGNDFNGNSTGTHLDIGTSFCNKGQGSATSVDIAKSGFNNPNYTGSNNNAGACPQIYSKNNPNLVGMNQLCN